MGIFDFLSKDPTKTWGDASRRRLTLDLSRGSLNNIKLDDPVDRLRPWGKPDNENAHKDGWFMYKESGLIVGADNQKIESFGMIVNQCPHYESFFKADLTITHLLSGDIPVHGGMLGEHLIDKLNLQVHESDVDDVEIIDYANIAQYTIEIESFADGRIKRVNFYKQLG